MQAALGLAATATLALVIGGTAGVKHASFDARGSAGTQAQLEAGVDGGADESIEAAPDTPFGVSGDLTGSSAASTSSSAGVASTRLTDAHGAADVDADANAAGGTAANDDPARSSALLEFDAGADSAGESSSAARTGVNVSASADAQSSDVAGEASGASKVGGATGLTLRSP